MKSPGRLGNFMHENQENLRIRTLFFRWMSRLPSIGMVCATA
jgi:hypothetical protein